MTVLDSIRGGLVVSCQPQPPLNDPQFVGAMIEAVTLAGAVGVRVDSPAHVTAAREHTDKPIIGIYKKRRPDYQVYITPDAESAEAVIDAGADIVALDGSTAPRPDGITLPELVRFVQARGALVMADISTLEEGLYAAEAGADIVSTTLSGYTPYSPQQSTPDLDLVRALAEQIEQPVIAEGRYNTPELVREAFECGAFSVVVGRAITEPQLLTAQFAAVTPRSHEHAAE